MEKPELLMPAGSFQKMEYAYRYGADAVYLGVPFFSLRARENEFNLETLFKARELANEMGKKFYLTANIFAKNRKINSFYSALDEWMQAKPDAFIMSDPGLMMIAKERHPDINLHLSVQSNCMNWQTVKFWQKSLGVSRIILSRELHLNEIKEIKQRVPEMELEAFVHGSICIAYSGRCLMSSYMSYRDANQGVCDNSCREKYNVFSVPKSELNDSDYFLEDLRDKGTLYQLDEDENGSYLMNAKDLRLIEYLKEIYDAGVCSFKVEGRTKSLNYVSLVSKTYRQAIDDMFDGKEFNKQLLDSLNKVANRGYHTGFMLSQLKEQGQNYDTSVARHFSQRFAGLVTHTEETPEGYIAIEVRNKIVLGQECEILYPNSETQILKIVAIKNRKHEDVLSAHGGAGICYFKTSQPIAEDFGLVSLKQTSEELYGQPIVK